jgi:ABC-type sugar transport system permease subunit/outer membrane protein assembly factor BamB
MDSETVRKKLTPRIGQTALALLLSLVVLTVPALAAGGVLWQFQTQGRATAATVTADGGRIAVGATDNVLRVFDHGGKPQWEFKATNSILGAHLTKDGQWLAVASEDRNVYLLDETGKLLWQYKAGRAMNNAAVSDDGSFVAATSNDQSFYLLDGQGNLLHQEDVGIDVKGVAVYGSGAKARAVVGSDDGNVGIYSRDGQRLLRVSLDYDVRSVAVTPTGARIVVGTSDGLVSMLNGATGAVLWQYPTDKTVNSVAISADGSAVLAGSSDKQAYLLDGTGKLLQTFKLDDEVLAVALSGDGKVIVTATASGHAQALDRFAAQAGQAATRARDTQTWGIAGLAALCVLALSVWAARQTVLGRHTWGKVSAGPTALLRAMWRARFSYLMILPTLLLLLVFNYYPAFSGLYHAFTEWEPGARTDWVGLANFQYLLTDRFFISSFRNTIILVIVTLIKTTTVPLLVAELIFNLRNNRWRYWLRTLFIVPLVLPAVVEILLWNNMYDPNIGLLNHMLIALGHPAWARAWYGDANVALASVIFIGFPWVNAFSLLIFYGGLIAISEDIFDASKVDGASGLRRFWHIDLPLLMGQTKLLLILGFINAVQTFELVYLTTAGGPGDSTYTPALELYYMAMRMDKMGVASAIGMVLFAIILVGTILNMRYVKNSNEFEA